MVLSDHGLRKILRFTVQYPKTLISTLLIQALLAATAPVSLLLFSQAIDQLVDDPALIERILLLAILSIAIGSMSEIFNNFANAQREVLSIKVYREVLSESYDHFVRANLPREKQDDFKTAFASSLNYVERIIFICFGMIGGFFFETVAIGAIIVWNFGWVYFLSLLGLALMAALLFIPLTKIIEKHNKDARDSYFRVNGLLSQIVTNLRLIQSYQTRAYEKVYTDRALDQQSKEEAGFRISMSLIDGTRTIVNALVFATLMVLVILDASKGLISIGALFLFFTYVQTFFGSISFFPFYLNSLKNALTRIQPILEADQLEAAVGDDEPRYFPQIEKLVLSNFRCEYIDGIDQGANYVFEKGQIYWLRGENGACKSTLLSAIMGLNPQAQVDVVMETPEGRVELGVNDRVRNIGYASQEPLVWDRSVSENLEYAKNGDFGAQTPAEFLKELKALEMFSKIDFDKSANELSGGQTQAVHIFRSIGKNSPILLLDEPTNALDGEVILELIESLRTRQPDAIIIMATHSEYLQKIATHELHLKRL